MALGLIRIDGPLARGLLVGGVCVSVVIGLMFAKWCFADAASPRAASKEMADLLMRLAPSDPQTHFALAVLYEKTFIPEDIEHSLSEYEKAAALSPNNYLSWLELGKARSRNGDFVGAEGAFARTLALAPNYADVHWAYGNFLLRSDRTEEGFEHIRIAINGKPELTDSATSTALAFFNGDSERVRQVLGSDGLVNASLARSAIGRKQYDEAIFDWNQIPNDEKRLQFSDTGKMLSDRLIEARHFRSAVAVTRDIWDDTDSGPSAGRIFNGDFEKAVRLRDARSFDWQIASGVDPQVAISDDKKHAGSFSLFLAFSSMKTSDLRSISQIVAVEPGTSYTFEAYYRAELTGSLAWEIADAADGKVLGRTGAVQPASNWMVLNAAFTVPTGSDGIVIRLVRDGCVSSVCPIAGKVWFDDLSLNKSGAAGKQ